MGDHGRLAPSRVPSLRGRVSDPEWATRVDLAACLRLIAHFGWDDLVYTHVSARIPDKPGRLLLNPFGWLFSEVTASGLVEIDHDGRITGGPPVEINRAGLTIHTAVHAGRADAGCVIHLHGEAGVAVSAQRDGLRPISQTALWVLPSLAYHDYEGVAVRADEKARLLADLGDRRFLILRNHGTLVLGPTIPEAFLGAWALERACRVQVLAGAGGAALREVGDEVGARVPEQARAVADGADATLPWPALRRLCDRLDPSYRH